MKVIKATELGFCYGVSNSIKLVLKELEQNTFNKKIYLLGMLVHNEIVCNSLKQMGVELINIDELDNILKNKEKGTIITTAHGTCEEIIRKIQRNGFKLVDSTCKIVEKNMKEIDRYLSNGFDIIYIGKKNHPESKAVENKVHLIENGNDVEKLNINNNRIVVLNQTTMSENDLSSNTEFILKKYPYALINTSICPATLTRQQKVLEEVSKHHDLKDYWLVFGDKSSNNTNKLLEIIKRYTNNCYLVSSIKELELLSLRSTYNIYVTSGTSTPIAFINKAIEYLEKQ